MEGKFLRRIKMNSNISFIRIMSKKLQWDTCCCDEVEFGVKKKQYQ